MAFTFFSSRRLGRASRDGGHGGRTGESAGACLRMLRCLL